MKTKKCWVASAPDYHMLEDFQKAYTQAGISTRYSEVGLYRGEYLAVFWVGQKDATVKNRIKAEIDSLSRKGMVY